MGALIITRISAHLGWRWAFPIIGAATVPVVIGLAVVMRDRPVGAGRRQSDWRAGFRALRNPSLVYLTIMGCAILTWLQVTINFDQLFLTQVRGFSKLDAGSIAAVWGFAGAGGQVVLPLASDRWGRRPVTFVASLGCAAALVAYLAGGFDKTGMQLLLGVTGFCGFGILPIVLATCVSESVAHNVRGAVLGVTNFFAVIIGTTLMPLVGGVIADLFGLTGSMWILVASQLVVAAFILAITETAPRVVGRDAPARGVG